jgi:N-hydroxyarylamine O-acetyltransferase
VSDEVHLDAYLKRINYAGSIAPTLETLQMLHKLHPAAIPFENLNPLMELPVRLQLSDLEQKLVIERRGGYCLEHNLLFKAVLEDMDFKVTALGAARLWGRAADDAPDPDGMVLLVDVGGTPYLSDVGCGGLVPTAPLRLKAGLEQETPNERYRLVGGEPVWRLECEVAGTWRPLYQFDQTARSFEDYVAMNDEAMARCRDDLRAARVEGGKRHTLRNGRLRRHENGQTETRTLATLIEIREVLTTTFGIALPDSERLDAALEKALRPGAND